MDINVLENNYNDRFCFAVWDLPLLTLITADIL